ncbi:MAG: zinc ribbon domain-containing protein [Desulfovibrio sp.]|nr:zinc ribbon domain-containing protein [Desulfovibrio sp.]
MPIYEYQCPKCQRVFEEWCKVSEAHAEECCPDCGTSSPRLISETSFVLKGGGWYVTDYGYRKGVKEDSGASAGPSSDDSAKSGASPAKEDAAPAKTGDGAKTPAEKSAPAAKPAAPANGSKKAKKST